MKLSLERFKEIAQKVNEEKKAGKEKRKNYGEELANRVINKFRKDKKQKEESTAVVIQAVVFNANGDTAETTYTVH